MMCSCGCVGILKVFNSFSYYYCETCRKEIDLTPKDYIAEYVFNNYDASRMLFELHSLFKENKT